MAFDHGRVARAIASLWLLLGIPISTQESRAADCGSTWQSVVDYMLCNDPQLAALNAEADHLYSGMPDKSSHKDIASQERWIKKVTDGCRLNTPILSLVSGSDAISFHTCLIPDYADRLTELAKWSPPRSRLRGRPGSFSAKESHFVFVGTAASRQEAELQSTNFARKFPFETFSVYPPSKTLANWNVALAAYADERSAREARNLAMALGLNTRPVALTLSKADFDSESWTAVSSTGATPATINITPPTDSDINKLVQFWERPDHAYYCVTTSGYRFPSKQPQKDDSDSSVDVSTLPPTDPRACDDGDMMLFNGLLCASGDQRGCDAAKASQEENGHWWRSPRRFGWEYQEKPDGKVRIDVSFSDDQALGVWNYLLTTRDRSAFEKWVDSLSRNRPCIVGPPDHCVVRGWPRYCTDDKDKRCTFRPMDCVLMDRFSTLLRVPINTGIGSGILGSPFPSGGGGFQLPFSNGASPLGGLGPLAQIGGAMGPAGAASDLPSQIFGPAFASSAGGVPGFAGLPGFSFPGLPGFALGKPGLGCDLVMGATYGAAGLVAGLPGLIGGMAGIVGGIPGVGALPPLGLKQALDSNSAAELFQPALSLASPLAASGIGQLTPQSLGGLPGLTGGGLQIGPNPQSPIPPFPMGMPSGTGSSSLYPAQTQALIEAWVTTPDFPLHKVAVRILLLQRLGMSDPELVEAANALARRQPENAFFEFLAHGASDRFRILLVNKCPAPGRESANRFQWTWEREDKPTPWTESMYWDCIFAANLLMKGTTQLPRFSSLNLIAGNPVSFRPGQPPIIGDLIQRQIGVSGPSIGVQQPPIPGLGLPSPLQFSSGNPPAPAQLFGQGLKLP